jgi:hypothetical protein
MLAVVVAVLEVPPAPAVLVAVVMAAILMKMALRQLQIQAVVVVEQVRIAEVFLVVMAALEL